MNASWIFMICANKLLEFVLLSRALASFKICTDTLKWTEPIKLTYSICTCHENWSNACIQNKMKIHFIQEIKCVILELCVKMLLMKRINGFRNIWTHTTKSSNILIGYIQLYKETNFSTTLVFVLPSKKTSDTLLCLSFSEIWTQIYFCIYSECGKIMLVFGYFIDVNLMKYYTFGR